MKYKCVKAFTLDTYDGDGFYVDGYMEIEVGEVYEVGNEKMEDLGMDWLQEKKILSLVFHNMEHSCRKEVREDE